MNILFPAALAGIGMVCLVTKKTLLGFLIGVQILGMAIVSAVAISGSIAGQTLIAQSQAYVISIAVWIPWVAGLSLAVRYFYLKRELLIDQLSEMKG